MKRIILISVLILSMVMTACSSENSQSDKPIVAVSVVPEATFVKAIAGELVDVVTMIPPGYSPANYQPTPQQMADFEKASIYFIMGMPTEEVNIIPSISSDSTTKLVHLDKIVGDVYDHRYFEDNHGLEDDHAHEGEEEHEDEDHADEDHEDEDHEDEDHDDHEGHSHEGRDPHIWMSPKRVIVMVETIRDELSLLDPDNADTYATNAETYIAELEAVDKELEAEFEGIEHPVFIMYHPSLGYLSDDYGLEMVALENEGKEATSRRLQDVIDYAKEHELTKVFYQEEFDSAQAETLAREIGGEAVQVAPLSENYIENLKEIAETLAGSMGHEH